MKAESAQINVVTVTPIVRGLLRSSLTYFTKEDFPVGSFVRVPIRKKEVLAIVMKSQDVRENKESLKRATFELKKLIRVEKAGTLPPAFVQAAEKTALYYATTLGSILGTILPKLIRENPELLPTTSGRSASLTPEPRLVALPDDERVREYRSIIRESFARRESVLFIVPTQEDGLRALQALSIGIESYVFATLRQSPKKLREVLLAAAKQEHPVLFITTPAFLSFSRLDLGTVIMERENSRAYRTLKRPFLHPKIFLEYLTKESGQTLIFGDSVLSLEALYKEREGVYTELSPLTWRIMPDSPMRIVDMRRKNTLEIEGKEDFRIFSKHLLNLLTRAVEEKKKVFLFGVRRGYASSTVCGHCGSLLLCQNCSAPLILHQLKPGPGSGDSRIYVCRRCAARRDSLTLCDTCGSWKLIPLGIGVERIVEEVQRFFPNVPLFLLDKDQAPTASAATEIMQNFTEAEGGILVGTELALLYLERVPHVAVVSIDSLFSVPDFSVSERIFYLLTRLKSAAREEMLVQTRRSEVPVIQFAKDGNILDFYRAEMEERRELFYPPFSLFVKVSWEGEKPEAKTVAEYLAKLFNEWKPNFMESRAPTPGLYVLSMILRVERAAWPLSPLVEKLLLLPADFSIRVDPDAIL